MWDKTRGSNRKPGDGDASTVDDLDLEAYTLKHTTDLGFTHRGQEVTKNHAIPQRPSTSTPATKPEVRAWINNKVYSRLAHDPHVNQSCTKSKGTNS